MKKISILMTLLAFATISFGQQDTALKPVLMQTDYLKKSKNQKIAAWILLGSGVALFTGGMIAHYNHVNDEPEDVEAWFFGDGASAVAGLGLIVAGGSIPLFISSSRNKKKANAATVFIEIEKTTVLQGTVFNKRSYPAVGVKIHL